MIKYVVILSCILAATSGSIKSDLKENRVYSIRLLPFHDQPDEDCTKMQLNIYATYPNGQVLLEHTAVILSGQNCKQDYKVLNSKSYSKNSGPEYIVKDEQLNGPIENFIVEHDGLYGIILLEKEKLMRSK